ncbi:endonuclease 4, partial [Thamnocephalis sphaerospora]
MKRKLATAAQQAATAGGAGVRKFIGAHVSTAGGLHNAIQRTQDIGGKALALFLQSSRQFKIAPLSDEIVRDFCAARQKSELEHVLPHGSYLVNLGNPDAEKRQRFYSLFLSELKRCEKLGISLYNFHPGSSVGACLAEESIGHIADAINRAHKATERVVCVLENTAGAGNTIGAKFEELAAIMDLVQDKSRVGVCLDTCHAFAAGYNLSTDEGYEETMAQFERIIGFRNLRGVHLNDSSSPLGSRRDRH